MVIPLALHYQGTIGTVDEDNVSTEDQRLIDLIPTLKDLSADCSHQTKEKKRCSIMLVEGLLSNVLSSVLMNGICCVHSMHEEETRRKEHEDFVRRTLQVEMERQRIIDGEFIEKQMREQGLTDAAFVAEARRRLLIATKIQARRCCSANGCSTGASLGDYCHYSMASKQKRRESSSSFKNIVLTSSVNQRVTSAPVSCVRDTEYLSASPSVVSSLFDEDEDKEEMDEIPVQ
jgi:hypothetical protein